MLLILIVMFIGACIGFLALFLISGDLAHRSGLTGPRRFMLSAGLGMGVFAISIKLLLIGLLMTTTKDHSPAPQRMAVVDAANFPAGYFESSYTGKWYTLPIVAPTPDGNALDPGIVHLGKRLFNEPRLSVDGKIACSSCHKLEAGGDDNTAVSTGIDGLRGDRNAPTVVNAAFLSHLFWDGRAASLEEQAKGPLVNPVEMGMASHATVEAAVRAMPGYPEEFARAFGAPDAVTIDNIAFAIASYERTLISPNTDYDRFVRGQTDALSPLQIRGMALFAGLGCRSCHRDPTFSAAGLVKAAGIRKPFPVFTDSDYVRKYDLLADKGSRTTADSQSAGLWRVPSLRNVAHTAPYFHNGSVTTLEEAVRVMAATQLGLRVDPARETETPEIEWNSKTRKLTPYRPHVLTQRDIDSLIAFLDGLSVFTSESELRGR